MWALRPGSTWLGKKSVFLIFPFKFYTNMPMPLRIYAYISMDNNIYMYLPIGEGRAGEKRERKGNDLGREEPMGGPRRNQEMAGLEQSLQSPTEGRTEAGSEGKEWGNAAHSSTRGIKQLKGKTRGKNPSRFPDLTIDLWWELVLKCQDGQNMAFISFFKNP